MTRFSLCNILPRVLLAALSLALPGVASAQNVLANGGFETGAFSGWTMNFTPSQLGTSVEDFRVHGGDWSAVFSSDTAARISQVIPTTPGAQYRVSLWYNNYHNQDDGMMVTWSGTTLYFESPVDWNPPNDWIQLSYLVTATASSTEFSIAAHDIDGFICVDDVSVVVENDSCASPGNVSQGGTFQGTLMGATNDGADCINPGMPDRWYRYTAAGPVRLTVSTCGTNDASGLDSVLSLYDGCGGAMLACSDDTNACGGLDTGALRDSRITRDLASGESVLIRVSKFPGSDGDAYVLNVSGIPLNDSCGSAIDVQDGATLVGTTLGATPDGAAFCGTGQGDVWYRFTTPQQTGGILEVRTCGSNALSGIDTVISMHAACGGVDLGCNDDWQTRDVPGACTTAAVDSFVDYVVRPGEVALIRVTHFVEAAPGAFNLQVRFHPHIRNGSFETGPGSLGVLQPGSTAMDTWTVTRGSVDWTGPHWQAADGSRSVDLNGLNSSGGVMQSVALIPNTGYRLSFSLAGNPDGLPRVKNMSVRIGAAEFPFSFDTLGRTRADMGWETRSIYFETPASFTVVPIEFYSTDPVGSYGAVIDNVQLVEAAPPCSADFNGDGFVNPDDLADFITCFFLQVQFPGACPTADFNADAFLNPDDLADYITAFFTSNC
jgi:choice-of-anchor C domain-containing protein